MKVLESLGNNVFGMPCAALDQRLGLGRADIPTTNTTDQEQAKDDASDDRPSCDALIRSRIWHRLYADGFSQIQGSTILYVLCQITALEVCVLVQATRRRHLIGTRIPIVHINGMRGGGCVDSPFSCVSALSVCYCEMSICLAVILRAVFCYGENRTGRIDG